MKIKITQRERRSSGKTGKSGSSLLGFNGQFGEVDTSISCVEWREQASEVEYWSKLALFT